MKYYKDLLLDRMRSKVRLFIGILFLLVAIAWVAMKILEEESIQLFNWIFCGVFILNAVFHILGGIGFPLESLIGKAFVLVDEEKIEIKPGIFETKQKINWNQIKIIESGLNQLLITMHDDSSSKMLLSKLEYSVVQDLKEKLVEYAKKKGVEVKV